MERSQRPSAIEILWPEKSTAASILAIVQHFGFYLQAFIGECKIKVLLRLELRLPN